MEHMYNPYQAKIEEIKSKHKRELLAAGDSGFMYGVFVTLALCFLGALFLYAGIK